MQRAEGSLYPYALFAAMLGMAGLPLYIFAPKFFVDSYGVSLTAIGSALFVIRLLDFVQDPILGWVADQLSGMRQTVIMITAAFLCVAVVGLFAVPAPVAPIIWFVVCMIVLFTSYSLLTIFFYAAGVQKAVQLSNNGHIRLASWREAGALIGVCTACVLPFALSSVFPNLENEFIGYSILFAILTIIAIVMMRREWSSERPEHRSNSVWAPLKDRVLGRLLLVTMLNTAPVAVTSTLFLFFVEYRLGWAEAAGPLLLLFFFAAACSIPAWQKIARKYDAQTTLLWAMALSIFVFAGAFWLQTGDIGSFVFVCILSGITLGADMVLLPALFARRIEAKNHSGGQAFGFWNFCTKATLAFAAITTLPLLEQAGFGVGKQNSETALARLSLLYALCPCALKLLAFAFLFATKLEDA